MAKHFQGMTSGRRAVAGEQNAAALRRRHALRAAAVKRWNRARTIAAEIRTQIATGPVGASQQGSAGTKRMIDLTGCINPSTPGPKGRLERASVDDT